MSLESFPKTRLRRMRSRPFSRALMQESKLSASDLIYPMFVLPGQGQSEDIAAMPGIQRQSLDLVMESLPALIDSGIQAIALFPVIESSLKTQDGHFAYDDNGPMPNAIKRLKDQFPELGLMVDVALDPYTTHGQDGLIDDKGHVLNDPTLEILTKQALCYANAGADVIAPSDMMDGRIGVIRSALERSGLCDVQILAYSAKYASKFYGPFREAVGSSSCLGKSDKASYQMDPANVQEAIREAKLDIQEGADMIMVKPGMPYLDVIRAIKELGHPTFAYQVSGEYTMLKSAINAGYLEHGAIHESLLAFKRAGADAILSYFAKEIAPLLA